jgi:hypothetical protein
MRSGTWLCCLMCMVAVHRSVCYAGLCTDVKPPTSGFTCAEQAGFGKCNADFLQGYCDLSCHRCATKRGAHPKPLRKDHGTVPRCQFMRRTTAFSRAAAAAAACHTSVEGAKVNIRRQVATHAAVPLASRLDCHQNWIDRHCLLCWLIAKMPG